MSKKSSSFKRKLKSKKVGFQYFRIWGWPISEYNRTYIESRYKIKPDHALFEFNGQLIHLYVEQGVVGYSNCDGHLSLLQRRRSHSLDGTLITGCYFRTKAQALRELQMYSSGCKTEGLIELIEYRDEIDAMDMFGGY